MSRNAVRSKKEGGQANWQGCRGELLHSRVFDACSCRLSFLGASPQNKYCPVPSHLHATTNPPLCSELPDLLRPQNLPDHCRHHCPCASCTGDPQEPRPSIMAQKCVHQGCGKMYTDQEEVCRYHPGPPIFHEGQKGKSYVTNPSAIFHFRPPRLKDPHRIKPFAISC